MTTPGYALRDLMSARIGELVHYAGSLTALHGEYVYAGECVCGNCFGNELRPLADGRSLLCVRGSSFTFVTDGAS